MKRTLLFVAYIAIAFQVYSKQGISDSIAKRTTDSIFDRTSIIDSRLFNKGALFSPLELIQGKIPGLNISSLNGNDPNPDYSIYSGYPSLYNTEPMYIINGTTITDINAISSDIVGTMEFINNPGETSVYGWKGSNGVIRINTIKGKTDSFNISYKTYAYVENVSESSSFMDANEWRRFRVDMMNSSDVSNWTKAVSLKDYNNNTNWLEEISQTKLSHRHTVNMSKGFGNTFISSNFSFNNNNGVIRNTNNRMYSGLISLSNKSFNDKLSVNLLLITSKRNFSVSNKSYYIIDSPYHESDRDINRSAVLYSYLYNPTVGANSRDNAKINPREYVDKYVDSDSYINYVTGFNASYMILNSLKLEGSYSGNYNKVKDYNYSDNRFSGSLLWRTSLGKINFQSRLKYNKIYLRGNRDNNYTEGSNKEEALKYNADYSTLSLSNTFIYNNKHYIYFNLNRESTDNNNYLFPTLRWEWSIGKERVFSANEWMRHLSVYLGYRVFGRNVEQILGKPSYLLKSYKDIRNWSFSQNNYDREIDYSDIITPSSFLPSTVFDYQKNKEYSIGANLTFPDSRVMLSVDYSSVETKNYFEVLRLSKASGFDYVSSDYDIKNSRININVSGNPVTGSVNWIFNANVAYNKHSLTDNGGDLSSVYKNSIPKYNFGVTNSVKYNGFELSVSLRGASGFEIANTKLSGYDGSNFNNAHKDLILNTDGNFVLEKGDYLKVDNLSLSYNVPLTTKYISGLKLYFVCNNLATFTKFSGDPEAVGMNGRYYESEYPQTRIFLLGCSINL